MSLAAAVFASGSGSNFQRLVEHSRSAPAGWRVALLVSDRPDAPVLERARAAGIPTAVIPVTGRDPDQLAAETRASLREVGADLVLLAGYLRLVPSGVVAAYRGRILNVHPALLPAFGGKGMFGQHVHRAVLASGVRITGATVHFVDERYDRGPILAQWPVPVIAGDTPATLAGRVLAVEHRIFPAAVDHLAARIAAANAADPESDRAPGRTPPPEGPWFTLAPDPAPDPGYFFAPEAEHE